MKKRLVIRSDKMVEALGLMFPLLALAIALTVQVMAMQGREGMILVGLVWGIVIVTYVISRPRYVETYTFVPADENHGAYIVIQQGRRRHEVRGIPASSYVYGQNWLEKRRGVGHVKVKGTIYKIRGISQGEEVMAWIQANFPEPKKRKKRRR